MKKLRLLWLQIKYNIVKGHFTIGYQNNKYLKPEEIKKIIEKKLEAKGLPKDCIYNISPAKKNVNNFEIFVTFRMYLRQLELMHS